MRVFALTIITTLLGGCGYHGQPAPMVNWAESKAPHSGFQADLAACQSRAKYPLTAEERLLLGAVLGAGVGVAAGAAGAAMLGAETNTTGFDAASGAALGGITAAGRSAPEPTSQYEVVSSCLRSRGYAVVE